MSHAHSHQSDQRAVAAPPTLSLLRLSALQRLAGVSVLIALVWAATVWALR